MRQRQARWVVTGLALSVGLVLAVYLYGTSPGSEEARLLPRCAFNWLTGWHCPGCGNTRATHALLHGNIAGAIQHNALFVVALPFLIYGGIRTWLRWMYPERVKELPFQWRWSYSLILVGCVVAFAVLRNLPWHPFDELAPKLPPSRLETSRGH
ncbi:MAG: DUF2752 domain-containing protein [Verrucomicrobiota bacterium]